MLQLETQLVLHQGELVETDFKTCRFAHLAIIPHCPAATVCTPLVWQHIEGDAVSEQILMKRYNGAARDTTRPILGYLNWLKLIPNLSFCSPSDNSPLYSGHCWHILGLAAHGG